MDAPEEKKSGVVAAEVQPVASSGVNGHHNRSASMSTSFLDAPGYSPSFFESHHAPRFSDTFEGFEPPRLSQEVQDTPKVTRPEGLSFTTPIASMKILEEEAEVVTAPPESTNPVVTAGDAGAEDYSTSPIANLVESTPASAAAPTTPAPAELTPTFGNVNSFSFGAPVTPQTPDLFTGANPIPAPSPITPTELVPALSNAPSFSFGDPTPEEPSPSTPTELIPALGNENSFPLVWPPTSTEPHVVTKKIPGHELLGSFSTTNQAAVEAAPEAPTPVTSDVKPVSIDVKTVSSGESEPVIGVEPVVQPKILEAAPLPEETSPHPKETSVLPEEPVVVATAPSASHRATESPIVLAADPPVTAQEPVVIVNKAAEPGVVQHETDTVTESKDLPVSTPPATFAFRNGETEKEVPATPAPKPGAPFLETLKGMTTGKKYRGPSDEAVRSMVVIPDYLSRNMANALATEGAAALEGPREGEPTVAPTIPILVFINSRSGGRLGPELMSHFEDLISSNQVYDLSKHSPSAVLRYGLGCLDRMASGGDECARQTRENLRILVAGGDGTVGWCLSSVGALREFSPSTSIPALGIIPLGTGNDLSRSFGWGGEFNSTAKSALKKCLVKALNSSAKPLDTWKAVVLPAKSVAAEDIQFPHSMHPQHHVPLSSSVAGEKHEKDETAPAFEGLFFNYFSVGMDAQVAYGFHHLRDEKPWLARNRKANEMIYSTFGCTQGWFCTACAPAPRTRAVANIMQLFVKRRGSATNDWEEIHIPSNIRALVICNLKSYAGGHNPWGKPTSSTRKKEGLEEQRPDDGLLEVMGLRDGWHSAFVLLEVATAIRLCQAEAVKMEFNCKVNKEAYLQMDGEPWMQPLGLPRTEPTVVVIDKLPDPAMVLKR